MEQVDLTFVVIPPVEQILRDNLNTFRSQQRVMILCKSGILILCRSSKYDFVQEWNFDFMQE